VAEKKGSEQREWFASANPARSGEGRSPRAERGVKKGFKPMKIVVKDISARHILPFLTGTTAIVTAFKNEAVLSLI